MKDINELERSKSDLLKGKWFKGEFLYLGQLLQHHNAVLDHLLKHVDTISTCLDFVTSVEKDSDENCLLYIKRHWYW